MKKIVHKQSMIKRCSCNHAYQDRVNGKGKRLMNYSVKANKYRCTVCGELN